MKIDVNKIDRSMKRLANEVPELLAAGITDNESGMVIAGAIKDPGFKIDEAGAYFTTAYKKATMAVNIVGGGLMKEILITAENQLNLMTTLKNGKYHLGVCVRSSAQLGMVRVISNKYCEEMEKIEDPIDLLPDYLRDVMRDVEDRYGEAKHDLHIPMECVKEGALSREAIPSWQF